MFLFLFLTNLYLDSGPKREGPVVYLDSTWHRYEAKPALGFEQSKAFTVRIIRFNIIGGQITALKRTHHKKKEKIIVRQITVALIKNSLWKRGDSEIVCKTW